MSDGTFTPEVFKTSRLSEFVSTRELTAQTGHSPPDWPLVAVKECSDNALDSCEEAGIAPVIDIEVSTARGEIIVTDNGPGLPRETIEGVLDFTVRASSREAYVAPTRGAQGNALKTILAMPFALAEQQPTETLIEAHGTAHRITFEIDPIRREPQVSWSSGASSVKNGTRITTRWPTPRLTAVAHRFFPRGLAYMAFNPHLAMTVRGGWGTVTWPASDPAWRKWRPSDPMPAHWYGSERLERLIAACVQADRDAKRRVRLVRDFIGGFRGLSGTTVRSEILKPLGLARAPLDTFFPGGTRVDRASIGALLGAMREHTKPVAAQALGVVGDHHFRSLFEVLGGGEGFRYAREISEQEGDRPPIIVEAAFAPIDPKRNTVIIAGVNFSPSLHDDIVYALGGDYHLDDGEQPVALAVHITAPNVLFADRGKSRVALTAWQHGLVKRAVARATDSWVKAHKRSEQEQRSAAARYQKRVEADAKAEAKLRKTAEAADADEAKAAAKAAREAEFAQYAGKSTPLRARITAEIEAGGGTLDSLTVLDAARDPYRIDTPAGHCAAAWFAAQINRLLSSTATVHLRGFHYILVTKEVIKPNGKAYRNIDADYEWLVSHAARRARFLVGYVDFERIVDERNAEPVVFFKNTISGVPRVELSGGARFHPPSAALEVAVPELDLAMPIVVCSAFPGPVQPCRIVLVGEKVSLKPVLQPIVEQYADELLLPTGEMSDTMLFGMMRRAAEDGRPTKVLYFSDFDPSGYWMPAAVSRKIQALRDTRWPDLDIDVHRVALTNEQVERLNLPSTPLKVGEKRADKWRAKWGRSQTEIDALAALQPDLLRQIALNAVMMFYDATLDRRWHAARGEWERAHRGLIEADPKYGEVAATIAAAHETLAVAGTEARDDIDAVLDDLREAGDVFNKTQADAVAMLSIDRLPEPYTMPAPVLPEAPEPLFRSTDDWRHATEKLIAYRQYDDDAAAPETQENRQ